MRFRNAAKIASATVLALLLGFPIFASPPSTSGAAAPSSEVNWFAANRATTLLESLQRLNVQLSRNGETLDTFARSNQFDWRSHAQYLHNVREGVNEAGSLLRELQVLRDSAHPWQRSAIDRIVPIAADLAEHTQAAIEHLRENQNHLFVPEYRKHLTAIGDRSADFKDAVNEFLDYGETQEKLQGLQRRLEISGS
jgi:hypothetical protein